MNGERSAPGSLKRVANVLTGMRALAELKPVPNWLDARLNTSYKDVYKAKRKGDTKALAKAERELARWQRKLAEYQAA